MKNLLLSALVLSSVTFAAASRVIKMETQKIDGAVHWVPEKVEVKPGEKVTFALDHKLEGGFDFHGFFIPELKVAKQVDRNPGDKKPTEIEVSIPKSMKPGEYKIGCHFHPAHVAATLVVK